MTDAFKYRAFLSYSHSDKKWADWLFKRLENYRTPKRLIGLAGLDGPVPARLFPIFRDRDELSTASALSETISNALSQSACLIVICSPAAAKSRYVNEEILAFQRLGRGDRVYTFIVDGEPYATDRIGSDPDIECFPSALKFEIGADGVFGEKLPEPLAADARRDGDGRENAKLKLVAGIFGLRYDDLKQRDLEAQRARYRRLMAVSSSVAVVLSGLLALSILFALTSESTRNAGLISQSKFLAQRSKEATAAKNAELGAMLALEALPRSISAPDRPVTREALAALTQAAIDLRLLGVVEDYLPETGPPQNGRFVTATKDNVVHVWDYIEISLITSFYQEGNLQSAALSTDGTAILVVADERFAHLRNLETISNTRILEHESKITSAGFTSDGNVIVIATADDTIHLWNTKSGDRLATAAHTNLGRVVLSQDGSRFVSLPQIQYDDDDESRIRSNGENTNPGLLWSIPGGVLIGRLEHGEIATSASFSPDSANIITTGRSRGVSNGRVAKVEDSSLDEVRIWSAGDGTLVRPLPYAHDVVDTRFSRNGKQILTIASGSAHVRDKESGFDLREVPLDKRVRSSYSRFCADGTKLATTEAAFRSISPFNSTISIVDIGTHRQTPLLQDVLLQFVAGFSEDCKVVALAWEDGAKLVVGLFNSDTGALITSLHHVHDMSGPMHVSLAQFSPNGSTLLTMTERSSFLARTKAVDSGPRRIFRIWNILPSPSSSTLDERQGAIKVAVPKFYSDKSRMIMHWRADYPEHKEHTIGVRNEHEAQLWQVPHLLHPDLSPDGARLALRSIDESSRWILEVFDTENLETPTAELPHGDEITRYWLSNGGTRILTEEADTTLRLWDEGSGWSGKPLPYPGERSSVVFSNDGSKLAIELTFDDAPTSRVVILDSSTLDELTSIPIEHGRPAPVFSMDGQRILTLPEPSEDNGLMAAILWNATTGAPISVLAHPDEMRGAEFSPADDMVVTFVAGRPADGRLPLQVWDLSTGPPRYGVDADLRGRPTGFFSSNGKRIATASKDGSVHLRDAISGALVARLAHSSPRDPDEVFFRHIPQFHFSPDGPHIVTTSGDNTARVWDTESGAPMVVLEHNGIVDIAEFHAGSSYVVTRQSNETSSEIIVWSMPDRCQDLIDLISGRFDALGLGLGESQRREYLLSQSPGETLLRFYLIVRYAFSWALPTVGDQCA